MSSQIYTTEDRGLENSALDRFDGERDRGRIKSMREEIESVEKEEERGRIVR